MHPHPDPGPDKILERGVSTVKNEYGGNDLDVATSMHIPVYARDNRNVHKVDQNGKVSNKQDKSMPIINDALKTINQLKR
ncbi:hypothetical protein CLV59_103414 [Chitinophaga dinghuensis]|uniref:Uncharacterized protein n=1 Tax=Chitinophaga dinghuensis TaxID=1539050 RepID=A0A327W4Z5_9BACT|nr:hypothetical protein CLV59_103414 [Chitinophaga dinghuensis]